MDTMRIYVACLASYNAGVLHGEWFDLDDYSDADDLYQAVKEQVLMTSRFPNVEVGCPACTDGTPTSDHDLACERCHGTGKVPSAEEVAIHDFEGFPEGSVGEYTGFARLFEIKERLEEAEDEFGDDGPEILEAFEYCLGGDDQLISKIREAYRGKYDSGADFSRELAEEVGEIPNDCDLAHYIDWEHVWNGRDRFSFSEHNGHFFWSDCS